MAPTFATFLAATLAPKLIAVHLSLARRALACHVFAQETKMDDLAYWKELLLI